MSLDLSNINWLAVVASVFLGQVLSTIWFVPLFGEPWAREYGAASREEHTKAVPAYTYGIQAGCTLLIVLSLAVLQSWLGVQTAAEGLALGALVAVGFCVANILPGQAFLQRWRVAALCFGCQSVMILAISLLLAVWK